MLSSFKQMFQNLSIEDQPQLTTSIENSPVDLERLVRLQKMLRVRLASNPPSVGGTYYPWMVGGNEPDFPQKLFFKNGRFALIGCSVLRSVEAIYSVYDHIASPPCSDGYTNVPKLFIVDSSRYVFAAWKQLKKLTQQCDSLKSFRSKIASSTDFFSNLTISEDAGFKKKRFLGRLQTFCKTEPDYLLFKHIVAKATVLRAQFQDPRTIEFIKNHVEKQPLAIYASNILEIEIHNSRDSFNKVINSILRLKPSVTLYALTKLCSDDGICPDTLIGLIGSDESMHLKALTLKGRWQFAKLLHISEPCEGSSSEQNPLPPTYSGLSKGFFVREQTDPKQQNASPNTTAQMTPASTATQSTAKEPTYSGLKGGFFTLKKPDLQKGTIAATLQTPCSVEKKNAEPLVEIAASNAVRDQNKSITKKLKSTEQKPSQSGFKKGFFNK